MESPSSSLRPLFKTEIPADSWRLEPLALRLFHDKALFYMHDLGAFVTNERVLAPYGWWIEGPGVVSGHLAGEEAFIETAEGRRCASARFPRCTRERSSR